MRANEIISEDLSHPCIVVDVQPEYYDYAPQICRKIIKFVNYQIGPILMFVNADRDGMTNDSIDEIMAFWQENRFGDEQWHRVTIDDKGFGWFRAWMDNLGTPDSLIIKVIRRMYQEKVNDSRMLFGGEKSPEYKEKFKEFCGEHFEDWMLTDQIITNWTSVAQLKKFNGAYIMGGGRNECLREVELLMNAFNIKYKRIDSLVY
jgi:hypothetical protein